MIVLSLLGCSPAGLDGFWVDLSGRVVDEESAPVPDATVTLAAADGTPVGEVDVDADGRWSLPLIGDELDGNVLVALVRADGFAEGRATFDVNLRSPEVTTLRAGPVQTWEATARRLATVHLAKDADAATVSGRVIDAITGDPVAGVPLTLQEGWNASLGDAAVADAVSGSVGEFVFSVGKPGMYTVSASASGAYAGARFPAFLTASGGRALGALSAETVPGELRAALTWGPEPFDLDLHLSAPRKGGTAGEDGTGQYHVWSGAPQHPERDAEVEARMERTDSDGQGPETVWVGSVAEQGELRLSVFDNDNRSDRDTEAMAASGALLQVWFGEDVPRYYAISPGEVATLWEPVELDVATALTYAVEAYSVGADPDDPTAF